MRDSLEPRSEAKAIVCENGKGDLEIDKQRRLVLSDGSQRLQSASKLTTPILSSRSCWGSAVKAGWVNCLCRHRMVKTWAESDTLPRTSSAFRTPRSEKNTQSKEYFLGDCDRIGA